MNRFYVIGISDSPCPFFSPEVKQVIAKHRIFSGGIRHHEIVRSILPKQSVWIDIKTPLDEVFRRYQTYQESIVVFASGDPLFYGFANTIRKRMPGANIVLYPWFNSLQMLAHQLMMPYQDMRIVSVTGRPWHELDRALIERCPKIGILTDHAHTPAVIARRLLEYGYMQYKMYVGMNLGNEDKQSIRCFSIQQAASESFETPNCLILESTGERHRRPFGIPDAEFALLDGRTKMITKMPIRLLSLSMLNLHEKSCLWDIGFCTGSVSVEAKLQFPHLHIDAFEVREEGRRLMNENMRRFGTPGIEMFIGDFLELDLDKLSGLGTPDAVFIGGHGGRLPQIIQKVSRYLSQQGTIVFNSVSADSLRLFCESLAPVGLMLKEKIHMTVDSYNPITICKAERQSNKV